MRRSPWFHNGFLLHDGQSGERRALGGVRDGDGLGEFFSGDWFGDGFGFPESLGSLRDRGGVGYRGSRWERSCFFLSYSGESWE
ncbi:hypothetical protein [Catenulispora rubra]|uniref:hypothetical protein n=1 Tax=Catenulispora rubra TaxID=280293 RepID=UPI001892263E|nr:hypothetical protein [Catenulispora rubra]